MDLEENLAESIAHMSLEEKVNAYVNFRNVLKEVSDLVPTLLLRKAAALPPKTFYEELFSPSRKGSSPESSPSVRDLFDRIRDESNLYSISDTYVRTLQIFIHNELLGMMGVFPVMLPKEWSDPRDSGFIIHQLERNPDRSLELNLYFQKSDANGVLYGVQIDPMVFLTSEMPLLNGLKGEIKEQSLGRLLQGNVKNPLLKIPPEYFFLSSVHDVVARAFITYLRTYWNSKSQQADSYRQ